MSQQNKNKIIVILLTFLLCLQTFKSQAEPPPFTPPDALSIEKPKLPDTRLRPPPKKPKFSLPPVDTTKNKDSRLSTAFRLFVKQIQLTGNTVFTGQELQHITNHYVNRTITTKNYKLYATSLPATILNTAISIPV